MQKKPFKKYLVISTVSLGFVLAGLKGFATDPGPGDTLVLCPQGEIYKCATMTTESGGLITKMKGNGVTTIIEPSQP